MTSFDPQAAGPSFPLANKLERVVFRLAWLVLARWTPPPFFGWRALVLRAFGAEIGPKARIHASVRVWLPRNLSVGEGALVGPHAELYNQGRIVIGARCVVSQRAWLCASTHRVNDRAFALELRPIALGDGCWVAAGAFVGPGVTMASESVLGARAALFEDTEAQGVYRGNPAVRIGTRDWAKG